MDYKSYRCNLREKLWCAAVSAAAAGLISWLFYHSWCAMGIMVPVYLLYRKQYQIEQKILLNKHRLGQPHKPEPNPLSSTNQTPTIPTYVNILKKQPCQDQHLNRV